MLQSAAARLEEMVQVCCSEREGVGIVASNRTPLGAGGLLPRETSSLSKAFNMFIDSPRTSGAGRHAIFRLGCEVEYQDQRIGATCYMCWRWAVGAVGLNTG